MVCSRHETWSHFVTRESSDPETQLTLFYNELQMSTCCRQTFAMGKRFASFYRCLAFACFWKVKFWKSSIKCQYFNDGWTDFQKKIYIFVLGFFWKPEKLWSHNMMTRWPGCERWPVDPVPCLVCSIDMQRSICETLLLSHMCILKLSVLFLAGYSGRLVQSNSCLIQHKHV